MPVYPDGDALSDWERRILDQIEHDLEVDFGAMSGHGDFGPLHVFALYAVVTEVALAFAVYLSMMAMATLATTLWSGALQGTRWPVARR